MLTWNNIHVQPCDMLLSDIFLPVIIYGLNGYTQTATFITLDATMSVEVTYIFANGSLSL